MPEGAVNQSVERAARLLGLFSVEEPELSLSELTARLGTSKASAYRSAAALRQAGLVRLNRGKYGLGPRIVELAAVALAGLAVVRIAESFLERLARESNETAVLSVWDGEAPVVVRAEDRNDQLVKVTVRTGSRLPVDSAQGRVFQAYLGLNLEAPAIAAVRRDGFAYDDQVVDGVGVIAVPVFQAGQIVATLAVAGLARRIPQRLEGPVGSNLRAVSEALTLDLGFVDVNGMENEPLSAVSSSDARRAGRPRSTAAP